MPVQFGEDDTNLIKRIKTDLNEELNMSADFGFYARKLHLLKARYRRFKNLLMRSGIDWDPHSNLMRSTPAFWYPLLKRAIKNSYLTTSMENNTIHSCSKFSQSRTDSSFHDIPKSK